MNEIVEEKKKRKFKFKIKPIMVIALSFLFVIFLGSLLLSLPYAQTGKIKISYIDNLFTSTSATCVTGLFSIPGGVKEAYSMFGQIIICLLIQLGGLGVTTIGAIVFMIISSKLSFSEQSLIKESWNLDSFKSIKRVFLFVLIVTLSFELTGAILSFFSFYFIHHFPIDEAIGLSIFHSISSFNNAGFDIIGPNSLIDYEKDVYLLIITSLLIISGGIGYLVIIDAIKKKLNFKRFTLQSKIAISYSFFLIVIGSLFIGLLELNNESNVGVMGSIFMSVSTRTAGFTVYDLSKFREATIIVMIILMFIGASPGGTGGGIKTTTLALLFAYIRGIVTDRRPYLFKRSIAKSLVRKALLIILLGLMFVVLGLVLICIFEMDVNYIKDGIRYKDYVDGASRFSVIDYAFEAMSAFGTVGLSTGFTPYFTNGSKIVLIILKYVGRIGPLTVSMIFKSKNKQTYRFAEEDVSIG